VSRFARENAMNGEDIGIAVVMGGIILGGTAIVGGITSGIIRSFQRQRMVELAQRERIALIERGVDPEKLPALSTHALSLALGNGLADERIQAERRKQGLVIAGLVFTFFGLGLATLLSQVVHGEPVFAVGAIPLSIGLALLLGSRVVKAPAELK
jgi:hypothetical protein